MMSARLKLTLVFAGGMVVAGAVLGFAVSASRTAGAYSAIGREALADADLALRVIDQAALAREPVLVHDSASGDGVARKLAERLDVIPGYLVIVGRKANVVYSSADARDLSDDDWAMLQHGIADLPNDGPAGVISVGSDRILFVAHAMTDTAAHLSRVVAGVRVRGAQSLPSELKTTLFAVVPLLIALASWGMWLALGGTFRRIELVRRGVADITDGRSLHRRLSDDEASPEIAALINTLNAMIARLETSFVALRRFTADASHELKTPLAVLRADVERAMSTNTRRDDKLVALEEALHETTRMADLVESLLTLARADEGRFDLHRERVDLTALVQEVYETAVILGEGAGVAVNLPFTTDVSIAGDRTRLRQLFLNLVTNAIKYTPRGGRVDIGLGRHPDNVTFAVRDTGLGIAAADLPHVFERFWRADRARSRTAERGGFGLGLAISQWIAQAHGGSLTVQSRLGKGSLFTLTLPLDAADREIPDGAVAAAE
ncbi:MAG: HAMP domain-containing histidine kinase [Gemmatimonadota bacterium]|nr:HAMP domain-containing histidine kinase [Gemmatimonadota bacterium]